MLTAEGLEPTIASEVVAARCRMCGGALARQVLDLGMSPLCESFLAAGQLNEMEPFYPLRLYLCQNCWLVQLQQYVAPQSIFESYAYFSSYSSSWVDHARRYCEMISRRLSLGDSSFVVEVASNDGYLLQHFLGSQLRVLGVEPARNVAAVSRELGVPTECAFFGRTEAARLASVHGLANLIVANNVLAHVPDLHDFIGGLSTLLAPGGTITIEFPHLLRLMESAQFDTIYHEHFSYFSLRPLTLAFQQHGLEIVDVEELTTHGGSLRLFVMHACAGSISSRVADLERREWAAGLYSVDAYTTFEGRVQAAKRGILAFLIRAREEGKVVAGYGAPGKGNTLLNYCGIRSDLLAYTVDRNPFKHGLFLPGTHIPIYPPDQIERTRPDYVFLLPWNLKAEIMDQLGYIRSWGGRIVVPIPEVQLL